MLYLLIVLISSIVGDTIILIASTRFNALKLNKFILAIIHHISICDLITDISNVLPILAAVWTEDWIFKGILASVSAFFASWSYLLSTILVVILTCSKFLLVRFPRKTRNWSTKKAHMVCGLAWLAVLPTPMPLILDRSHQFVEHILQYHIGFENDMDVMSHYSRKAKWTVVLTGLSSFVLLTAPFLVMIFSALTLKVLFGARQVSRRSRGSLRWQGIVTVVLTGAVFCVSMLPHCIYVLLMSLNISMKVPLHLPEHTGRRLQFLTFVNVAVNFFICCLTVKSFKTFLLEKIRLIRSKFRWSECSDSRSDPVRELQ